MLRSDAIWLFDSSANLFVDLTDYIRTNTDFSFLADSNDIFYIGLDRRFIGLYVNVTTAGDYTNLNYFYSQEGIWKKLSLIDAYAFASSKYQRWLVPNDWIKCNFTTTFPIANLTPPDDNDRYWVKITVTAVTTTAVIDLIKCIPFVEYATPDDVSDALQLKRVFDNSTKPTDIAVEDFIKRAEDRIDYRTRKSWRFNAVTEEIGPQLMDYNRYGVYPRHRNLYKVYSVSIWNGNSWDALTEGRANDYFTNYDLGMIYFTRLFLLPAAYGMTGRYFHWGFGEYKNSVKIDYVYGRDPEVDSEFYIVKDIASKMAAVDILRHHDYSQLVSSGVDKIPLESKVRLLEEQIEIRLDELTGVALI